MEKGLISVKAGRSFVANERVGEISRLLFLSGSTGLR